MRNKRQKGFSSLLAVILAAAITLILLAGIVPATVRATQSWQEETAASVLARIDFAETQARQLYGGYLAPQVLAAANLTLPLSVCNPGLLNPPDAQSDASRGYVFVWTANGTGTAATGCTSPPELYASYSATAQPISRLSGDRYFFTTSTTGLLYMQPGSPITAVNPAEVYSINVMGGVTSGSGSGSNNASGSNYKGIWSQTGSYNIGDEVLRSPAAINGEQGPVGIYINESGQNNEDPATSGNADWQGFAYGLTPVGYSILSGAVASANPNSSQCVTGSGLEFSVNYPGAHDVGCPVLSSTSNPQNPGAPSTTYHTFSVSTGSGAPFTVDAMVLLKDFNTGNFIGCFIGPGQAPSDLPAPSSATSCSFTVGTNPNGWSGGYESVTGLPKGESSNSSGFAVASTDSLQIIVLDLDNLGSYSVSISWQLTQ